MVIIILQYTNGSNKHLKLIQWYMPIMSQQKKTKEESQISWNPIKCRGWRNDNGFKGLVTFIWLFSQQINIGFLPLKCGLPDYNLKIECGKSGAIPFPSLGYTQVRLPSWVYVCLPSVHFSLSLSFFSLEKTSQAITCSFECGFP